jgi:hypothetical protein
MVVAAALGSQAHAGLVPILTSPSSGGMATTFNYNLVFSTANGVESLSNGNLVTLYDFDAGATVGSITVPLNIGASVQNLGITPVPSSGSITPVDNPAVSNITFTYTGPTLTADTTFAVSITLNGPYTTRTGQYAAQNASLAPGGTNTQLGSVFLPVAAVPEPSSLVLAGTGLCCVAGLTLRRSKRA